MPIVKSPHPLRATVASQSRRRPFSSFGPFRIGVAVPWLLFATVMRLLAVEVPPVLGLVLLIAAQFAIFFAFLLAASKTMEFMDGASAIEKMQFDAQWRLAKFAYPRLQIVCCLLAALCAGAGRVLHSPWMLSSGRELVLGFDGIAYDQRSDLGRVLSAFLAATLLLIVLERAGNPKAGFAAVAAQFRRHWRYLLPAILLIGVVMMNLSVAQAYFRGFALDFTLYSAAPALLKNLNYVGFILAFASLRLIVTLAILYHALRAARRAEAAKGMPSSATT